MKRITFVVLALLLSVLEITVTWRFSLGWHNYGLFLTAISVISLFDIKSGLISAIITGIMLDCIQGRILGLYLVSLLIVVLIINFFSKFMNGRNVFSAIILVMLVTFVTEFGQYIVFFVVKGDKNVAFALTKLIIPQVIINTVCSLPIYWLVKALYKKLKIKKERWEY